MQVKSVSPAEAVGDKQVFAASPNIPGFADLLAVLLQGTNPSQPDEVKTQGKFLCDFLPKDLPSCPAWEPEDTSGDWMAALSQIGRETVTTVSPVTPVTKIPMPVAEVMIEDGTVTEVPPDSCGIVQPFSPTTTEIKVEPTRSEALTDEQQAIHSHAIIQPAHPIPSSKFTIDKPTAQVKTGQATDTTDFIAKAENQKNLSPNWRGQATIEAGTPEPRGIKIALTQSTVSDESRIQGGPSVQSPPQTPTGPARVVPNPGPEASQDTFQDGSNYPRQSDKASAVPAVTGVSPGRPPAKAIDITVAQTFPAEKSRVQVNSSTTDAVIHESKLTNPAPVSKRGQENPGPPVLAQPESGEQANQHPRTVSLDEPVITDAYRKPPLEVATKDSSPISHGRGDISPTHDVIPRTKILELDHNPADAANLSKLQVSGSSSVQEIIVPVAELEQVPAYVVRQLSQGQGGRQVIFKLDPPELGQVVVTIKEYADKGMEARVVLDQNIPQQQVDALVARFNEMVRPELHIRVEVAASFSGSNRHTESSGNKKDRDRQHTRSNAKSVDSSTVFYG